MLFFHDELDALRADSLAHRMDAHRILAMKRKALTVKRLLMIGATFMLASLVLMILSAGG